MNCREISGSPLTWLGGISFVAAGRHSTSPALASMTNMEYQPKRAKLVDDDEGAQFKKIESIVEAKIQNIEEKHVKEEEEDDVDDDDDESDEDSDRVKGKDDDDISKFMTAYEFQGQRYVYRERAGAVEEREGRIEFRVVHNNGSEESFLILSGLKLIFQKQLPKMPREYISRLVYDRNHASIAVVRKPMTVVGGIAYRPFESHKFAEIVFCAISSSEQVRGYGAHLMNHFKDYVRNTSKIEHFLTYADNYAVGYFKKQGFTKNITLPKELWKGYIKDYEGGTLMQCTMVPRVRYLDVPKILLLQRTAINSRIKQRQQQFAIEKQVRRKGLEKFRQPEFQGMDPLEIPGVKETGWTAELDALARKPRKKGEHGIMQLILSEMKNNAAAWPFMTPVSKEDVPDYYDLIAEPMDLSTMDQKLEKDQYDNMDSFVYDARLIFNNCRKYNNEATTYYKNATKLEKFFNSKLKEYPEYEHLVS